MPTAISGSDVPFPILPNPGFLSNIAVASNGANSVFTNTIWFDDAPQAQNAFIQVQTKFDVRKSVFMRFDGASTGAGGLTIPKGSLLTDAYLRLFSQGVLTATMSNVHVAVVARDGIWNRVPPGGDIWGAPAALGVAPIAVRDTGAAALATIAVTPNNQKVLDDGLLDSTTRLGQHVLTTAAGTLGACDFTLYRTSTATQNVFVDVYAASAGRPTGAVLATSGAVAYNTLGLNPGGAGVVTFTFSGGNQIAIANATNYVFVVRGGGAPIGMRVDDNQPGITQKFIAGGLNIAFSDCNYPQFGNLPILYEADDVTIRTAPHGGIANIATFPPFSVDNTWYDVRPTNFRHLIQQWIDDPAYVEGSATGSLGVTVVPSNLTETSTTRQWDAMELRLSWRPRRRTRVT